MGNGKFWSCNGPAMVHLSFLEVNRAGDSTGGAGLRAMASDTGSTLQAMGSHRRVTDPSIRILGGLF